MQIIKASEELINYCKVKIRKNFLSKFSVVKKLYNLLETKNFFTAESLCKEAIKLNPKNAELHAILAYIYQQTARYSLAIESCNYALSLKNHNWHAYFTLGVSLRALKKNQEARLALEKAHELHPTHDEVTNLLLETIADTDGIQVMVDTYNKISKTSGASYSVSTNYICNLFNNGHTEIAKQAMAKINSNLKVYTLSSVTNWAKQNNLPILSAGETEHISIANPPILNHTGYHQEDSPPKIVLANTPYVAELHDVTIFSQSSIITVDNNKALNDSATHPLFGEFVSFQYDKTVMAQHRNELILRHKNYPISECQEGIFLSGLASNAFGHWVPEFLPKLQFLEHHPDFKKLPIIVDEQMPPSHLEYLKYLVQNPIILLPTNTGMFCRKLLVSPSPTFYTVELLKKHNIPQHELGPLSPASMRFLRERVMLNISGKSSYGPKLYFSRRNMQWRRLINDEEIAEFLAGKGFTIINPETVGFADQVRMFREAECIVAPNGSALLNVIFSKPDVKLIVLSQPDLFNWGGYYGPMRKLGYEMVFVTGDELQDNKHSDYQIPVERLREALILLDMIKK